MQGIITNIQRFSMHDGPGVRSTVFFKGCPLACLWCHNPETLAFGPALTHNADTCIGCGRCVQACPSAALSVTEQALSYCKEACTACYACAKACPSGALSITGKPVTVSQVLAEVLSDRGMYARTGGGVTLSGGEASAQPEFALALMRALHEEGLHVALDTCGHAETEPFLALCQEADLILFDIKHTNPDAHRRLTGQSSALIRHHFALLGNGTTPIQVRIPVVPGLNDNDDTQRDMASLIGQNPMVQSIVLLGYHALGQSKVLALGDARRALSIAPPTKEHLSSLAAQMQDRAGLPCTYR